MSTPTPVRIRRLQRNLIDNIDKVESGFTGIEYTLFSLKEIDLLTNKEVSERFKALSDEYQALINDLQIDIYLKSTAEKMIVGYEIDESGGNHCDQ